MTPEVLVQAHVARAAMLVVAVHDTVDVRKMLDIARMLNPSIHVLVRTHNAEEADLLRHEGVNAALVAEHELAASMGAHILAHTTARH